MFPTIKEVSVSDFPDLSSPLSSLCQLLVFTRYPELGKAKTRLIPALGVQGATELHRQLAEWAIAQARQLQDRHKGAIQLVVYFTGSTVQAMQTWLGADLVYRSQGQGDLGEKLYRAIEQSFAEGMEHIVVIGTDCPSLTPELFTQAFHALDSHDLVLGPAADGGYYLIGLSRPISELFQNIHWGTSEVFSQTLKIAHALELSYVLLPVLSDIDRPADLQCQLKINP
ncbi:hypothetical protein BI308_08505 [Roseofilum reptotaenium AO1-A]|uniref:Glycosyltransferase n=1 Tax=Roseofilum reptotaenium AO1-A TaxID=1925591 RepID=A0A1L9QTM3_9CYAN|nr:hypothetical protein BI308_08505 [Roseofilum reptotaenium AO1-A]